MRDRRKDKFPCIECGALRERRAISGLCKTCSGRRSMYSTIDAEGRRECIDCTVRKPLDQFAINQKQGKRYAKHQCRECYNKARREKRVYIIERPYACRTCKDARVWDKGSQCRECFRERQRNSHGSANDRETHMPKRPLSERTLQAAKHDSDQLRLKASARRADEPDKYMEIAYGEIWHLTVECKNRCGKWVLIPAKCYECATGRPRRFLRAEERRELEVAVAS